METKAQPVTAVRRSVPKAIAAERPSPGSSARPWWSVTLRFLAVLGSYGLLASLAFWPVWTNWSAQLHGCNCWDQLLLEWFLNWAPAALAHGHPVLVTNAIDAPGGVNIMWNTSVLALGTLAAPLTETIGVVHTMALLLTLSLALSVSTMFLLLRRWTSWWPAAWFGGLLYGSRPSRSPRQTWAG